MALPGSGKLVRDRIPEIIQADGKVPLCTTVTGDDLRAALEEKAREEIAELCDAPPESLLEEIADVYEVLLAIAKNAGVDWPQVENVASKKRDLRGGFSGGTWLLATKD